MTGTLAIIHGPAESALADQLASGLSWRGIPAVATGWELGAAESFADRLAGLTPPEGVVALVGRSGAACTWVRELRTSWTGRIWWPQVGSVRGLLEPLLEDIEPLSGLRKEHEALVHRVAGALQELRQGDLEVARCACSRLDSLLPEAAALRCRLAYRFALQGHPWADLLFVQFPALPRPEGELREASWESFGVVRRRLIHDARNDLAVLPLLLEVLQAAKVPPPALPSLDTTLALAQERFRLLLTAPPRDLYPELGAPGSPPSA